MISHNLSFCYRFECFLNYHITNMTKLSICIIANLLVYQFITKLFRNIFCNLLFVFRFKTNIHNYLITSICLLMDIK